MNTLACRSSSPKRGRALRWVLGEACLGSELGRRAGTGQSSVGVEGRINRLLSSASHHLGMVNWLCDVNCFAPAFVGLHGNFAGFPGVAQRV